MPNDEKQTNNGAKLVPYISPYKQMLVFQQAVCMRCSNMIVVQNQVQVFETQKDLEVFALEAHNKLVHQTKALCVMPELKIFFGYMLELKETPITL